VERALGPAYDRLPWIDELEARKRLGPRASRALAKAEQVLGQGWQRPRSGDVVLEALQTVVPAPVVVATSGLIEGVAPWALSETDGTVTDDFPASVNRDAHAALRRFDADPLQPYADRPANLAALTVLEPSVDASLEVFSRIWEQGDIRDQLRTFLFDGEGRYRGYFCFARRNRGSFGEEEHALIHALQPALREWAAHAHALGIHPCRSTGIPVRALDAFAARALVLHGERIVFANEAARAASPPSWRSHDLRAMAKSVRRFGVADSRVYELVILRAANERLDPLSPALREIAELLAEGSSDKEIAARTGRPLATVRTYVRRVFAALDIHSRRELMGEGTKP